MEAQSPFGCQQAVYGKHGLMIYCEHRNTFKCVLPMCSRSIFIEYRPRSTRPIRKIQTEIYDYRMLGMRVPDAFIGPRIEGQDSVFGNTFSQIHARYCSTPF